MSTTVDQRVVEMRFDNSHFEKNVSTTMSTLDKFKEKLGLSGATKGLEDVQSAASKVNINPLATAAESVSVKFSALQVMAVTALQNITNSAIDAGKRIVSALTIDPIKMGFTEYETQINAVQTILANTQSKGTTLDDVNKALDELNTYADRTIYNFTEMTRNIGTFTAAGVDLDTSVAAIKGIANLAAISGSTSQQASTAMYQLSQALASGTVKLMDWNSVVNAGMGGQVFQDALKETARLHGIAIDQMIEDEGSFRETLSNGWLSSEILTETLSKFTGDLTEAQLTSMGYTEEQAKSILKLGETANDAATKVKTFTQLFDTLKEAAQSGWTQTWELLVGDFEEAKELFTEISDAFGGIIGGISEARNTLLDGALSSKWDKLEEQVTNVGISFDDFQEKLKETAKAHGVDIDKMIEKEGKLEETLGSGWLTSDIISETLRKYTDDINVANAATGNMADALAQFGDVVEQVIVGNFGNGEERIRLLTEAGYDYKTIQDLVNKVLLGTTDEIENLSDAQLENLGYTKEQIEAIRLLAEEAEKAGTPLNELIADLEKPSGRSLLIDTFRNALTGLGQALGTIRDAWLDAFPPMTSEQLYKIIERIHAFSEGLIMSEDSVGKLKRTFDGLFAVVDLFTTLTGGALKVGLKLLCKILGLADVNILDVTASVGDAVSAFRDWLFENNLVVKGLEKVGDALYKGASKVKTWLKSFVTLPSVQATFEKFKTAFSKALPVFQNLLSNGGTALVNFGKKLVDGVKNIKAWIDEFKEVPNVKAGLMEFKTNVSNILSKIKEFFGVCRDGVTEFIDKLKSLDSITLDDIVDALRDFKTKIAHHFSGFGSSFDGVKEVFKTLRNEIKQSLGETGEDLAKFVEMVVDFFVDLKEKIAYNFGFGEILAAILGVGTITIGNKLANALSAFASPLESFGDLLESVGKAVKTFNGLMKATKLYLISQSFLALALGIVALAGAVALLTLVDQGKLWSSVGVIAVLGGVVVAIATAMTALNKSIVKGAQNAATIIAIAGAVLILVVALKLLATLNVSKIVGGILTVVAMMAALVGASILLAKFAPEMFTGSIGLIAFAAAVLILAQALKSLTKMDYANIEESLLAIIALMGTLSLAMVACKGVKIGSAFTALAVVIALKLLINMLDDISNIDLNAISANIESFAVVFGMLIGLIATSYLAGQNAAKAGVAVLAVSVSLLLMVSVIKQLAKVDPSSLKTPLIVIGILEALFAGIIAITALAGNNATKAGAMLLMMAGTIVILTLVIVILSKLDPEGLWHGVAAIAALEACIIALVAVTAFAKPIESAKSTLIILVVAIGVLAAALVALSLLDADNVYAATVAMSAVMAMFALLVASSQLASGANATLIIMTVVVAAIGAILYLLAGLPVESTLAVAASLSVLILSLSAACALLTVAGAAAPAALTGIGVLAALIVAVGALMVAIGALVDCCPKIEEFLDRAIPVLEKIGYGLGNFFGSIVGGFADGLTSGLLSGIADSLSAFMLKLEPFLDGASRVDSEMLSGIKRLVEVILLLTAANLIDGIASWFTGGRSIEDFAVKLPVLGLAIACFSDVVKGKVDKEAVETAANAGKLLTELAKSVPNSGGLLGFICGENDIAGFAVQLPILGRALVDFSAVVKDKVDKDAVETAADAGKLLTTLSDTVPNTGGLLGFLTGNNDIAGFAIQLPVLARAIVDFSNVVKGKVDKDAVETATQTGELLTNLSKTVPNTGGLLGFITGDNDIAGFAVQLPILARAIVDFSSTVSGRIDTAAVETATSAGALLVSLANTVPNTGGLVSFITGNNDLSGFSAQLPILATAVVAFSSIVNGKIDTAAVETAASAGALLVEVAKNVSENKLGGLRGFLTGGNMTTFAAQLPILGGGIASFYTKVSDAGINEHAVSTATNCGMMLSDLGAHINQNKTGGLLTFLVGGNMTTFAAQLPNLGEGIAQFSSRVVGRVSKGAVEAATQAGELIATLSSRVSAATGSWLSNLFGGDKKKFENFKQQVPLLGEAIVAFSQTIAGRISTNAVASARTVSEILSILSTHIDNESSDIADFSVNLTKLGVACLAFYNSLDEIGLANFRDAMYDMDDAVGKIASWLTEVDLGKMSDFGKTLKTFGEKVDAYHDDITSMNLNKLEDALEAVYNLMFMAIDMSEVDVTGMTGFGTALKTLGTTGVDEFVASFTNADMRVTEAAVHMLNTFKLGAESKLTDVIQAFDKIINGIIESSFRSKYSSFTQASVYLIGGFKAGAAGCEGGVKIVMSGLCDSAVNAIKGKYNDFFSAGEYSIGGFNAGIRSKASAAAEAARTVAKAAVEAINDELDINSPSKVLYESGAFSGMGFVNALTDYADKSYDAGTNLADSAKRGLRNAVAKIVDMFDSDVDTEPTIRPVLDLTNVESGARRLNTMFARSQAMSIDVDSYRHSTEGQNGVVGGRSGNTYQFTQNNYSPKSLSRIDIYRQTKNQFSAMERMVEA